MKSAALRSAFAVVALGSAVTLPLAFAGARQARSDCPGKIVCPLTGEEVCRDRCPLGGASTAGATETALSLKDEADLPPCCRNKY